MYKFYLDLGAGENHKVDSFENCKKRIGLSVRLYRFLSRVPNCILRISIIGSRASGITHKLVHLGLRYEGRPDEVIIVLPNRPFGRTRPVFCLVKCKKTLFRSIRPLVYFGRKAATGSNVLPK
jgi:hypothetical protein